jgi:hypothetical protein
MSNTDSTKVNSSAIPFTPEELAHINSKLPKGQIVFVEDILDWLDEKSEEETEAVKELELQLENGFFWFLLD